MQFELVPNMNTMQKNQENLCRLADQLLRKRSDLIDDWRRRAKADEQLPTLNTLSKKEFLDHIPHVLDVLDQQMRSYGRDDPYGLSQKKSEKMEVHGLSRWQQGFSISEVVRDWNHLRRAILEELGRSVETWEGEALSDALSILADLISEGVSESVAKFEEIRQAEARSHMLDLRNTIETLHDLVESQSERHRETYHDLKGHLGILANFATLLKSEDGIEDSLNKLYSPLEDGLNRSLEILENVKLHTSLEAKQERLEFSRFDASKTIRKLLQPYEYLAKDSGLGFEVLGPDTFEVESDPNNFARIVQNLMHNALKFTESGNINVTWGCNGRDDHWILRIQNTGTIAPVKSVVPYAKKLVVASEVDPVSMAERSVDANQEHTFKNASTTRPELADNGTPKIGTGGEGIGLSIAKRLSDLIGGRLIIESNKDDYGLSAVLHLPIEPQAESRALGS